MPRDTLLMISYILEQWFSDCIPGYSGVPLKFKVYSVRRWVMANNFLWKKKCGIFPCSVQMQRNTVFQVIL